LDWGRLNHVLWHVSRAKRRTASFGAQLGLDINALLEQDTLQKRVLVTQHQTLIRGMAVGRLQVVEILLMNTDRLLQLLDVLGPPLAEGSLSLAVALLSLL
jgi:hypothetical protein